MQQEEAALDLSSEGLGDAEADAIAEELALQPPQQQQQQHQQHMLEETKSVDTEFVHLAIDASYQFRSGISESTFPPKDTMTKLGMRNEVQIVSNVEKQCAKTLAQDFHEVLSREAQIEAKKKTSKVWVASDC